MFNYNKYKNKKTEIDGIVFDSKKEAKLYEELKLRKKAGDIINFECQPEFELLPAFFTSEGQKIRKMTYRADFLVFHDGLTEIIDVKGKKTAVFQLKWKLMLWKHGRTGEYKFTIV